MAATFCELKQKEYLAENAWNKTVEKKNRYFKRQKEERTLHLLSVYFTGKVLKAQ